MIIHPKEDVHLDRHVPEEIILSCELSRPNSAVSWYKDGQKLQESENIKMKIEGPYRRLKILSSRVEDSGEYVCDTADDSIFFHLSITGENPHAYLYYTMFTIESNQWQMSSGQVKKWNSIAFIKQISNNPNIYFQNLQCKSFPQVRGRWNCVSRPLRGWY